MRRLQARGIFAALENENLEVPPVEEAATELPDHAESVEADLAELNSEHADIAEHDAQIDEAEESIATLESIREELIEADKEGGLSRSGARILQISLEHIHSRLGLSTEKVIPALESFGGTASRQSATQIALETIGETVSKVWAAIVEAAKKAWEWIKGWYMKLFDANTKLAPRADALHAAAEKITSDTPKNAEIQNESLAKALWLGEATEGPAVIERLEKFAGEFTSGAGSYFANLTKLIDSVRAGHPVDLKPEEMSLGLKHMEGSEASKLGVKVAAGSTIFASDELPGAKYFVSAWSGTTEGSFVGMVEASGANKGATLSTGTKENIQAIAAAVKSIQAKVASTKSDLDAAGKTLEALIAVGEAQLKASGAAPDEQSKSSVELARVTQKLITGAATAANKYLVDTCQAMLAWGELSVKAHNGTAVSNAAEKVGEKLGEAKDAVKDAAGAAVDKTKELVGKAADKVGAGAAAVKAKATAPAAPAKK